MLLYMAKGIWQMRIHTLIWSDYPDLSYGHNHERHYKERGKVRVLEMWGRKQRSERGSFEPRGPAASRSWGGQGLESPLKPPAGTPQLC